LVPLFQNSLLFERFTIFSELQLPLNKDVKLVTTLTLLDNFLVLQEMLGGQLVDQRLFFIGQELIEQVNRVDNPLQLFLLLFALRPESLLEDLPVDIEDLGIFRLGHSLLPGHTVQQL